VEHIKNLFDILLAAHAVAIVIVNLTPTPKDNEAVARFYKVLEFLAGIITKLAKK
jgi:hypothetical protein